MSTTSDPASDDLSRAERISQMIAGYRISQCVYVIAKLGIPDLLGNETRDSHDLAKACGANPEALYRLLRFLAAEGLFVEDDEGRFALTPLGALLQTGAPWEFRAKALGLMHGEKSWYPWGDFLYTVQTGRPAFDHLFGKGVFEHLAESPEDAKMWYSRGGPPLEASMAVAAACDFSGIDTLADVGGCYGDQICAILQAHPHLNGILFDLPHVVEKAKSNIEAAGVAKRCRVVGGSFLKSVPRADAYMMRSIIHDWDDEHCLTILKNCHQELGQAGKVFIVDRVMSDKVDRSALSKSMCMGDLHMMVLCGGVQRTERQFEVLLGSGGFKLTRIIPVDGPGLFTVFEAVRT